MNSTDDTNIGTAASTTEGGSTTGRMVTGLYKTREEAQRVYTDLTTRLGYKSEDVSVLMSDATRDRDFGNVAPGTELEEGSKATEGLGVGSALGGTLGAVVAGIAAIGTAVALPGLGLVIAGPLAAALVGAGAGGAAGGVLGALIGAGIPEGRAKEYEAGISEGGIVVGVRARDEAQAAELEREFASTGGSDIKS